MNRSDLRVEIAAADHLRAARLFDRLIEELQLDLSGLTVFTEAASGPYLWTPLMAARAGASRVYAVTRDSHYATAADVERDTRKLAMDLDVADTVVVLHEKRREEVSESDIVTNSGFVRPIDGEFIGWMKPTAVIPLMWETWEFRVDDIDLAACRRKGILVLGTNEHKPPCDLTGYSAMTAVKLLLELGLEVYKNRVLVLGGQLTLGEAIVQQLRQSRCETDWFSAAPGKGRPYEELAGHFRTAGVQYDAIIVAEHGDHRCLLGSGGFLSFDDISRINPAIRIGVISGNVNTRELASSGIFHLPRNIRAVGYVSYLPGELGPRPVMELYAAGLKVGEAMARARRKGLPVANAAAEALAKSPAMDFEGPWAWAATA